MEPRKEHRSPYARARRLAAAAAICAAALFLGPPPAFAQLDPLLFLQKNQPNVIIAVDVANRMQFDADGNYFDPFDYPKTGAAWEKPAWGLGGDATATYRRIYKSLAQAAALGRAGRVHGRVDPDPRRQEPALQRVLVADAPGRGACRAVDRGPGQRPRRPLRPPEDAPAEPAHRRTGQRRACLRDLASPAWPDPVGRERRTLEDHHHGRRRRERVDRHGRCARGRRRRGGGQPAVGDLPQPEREPGRRADSSGARHRHGG